jgi:FixJ family two-component response regulator
MEAGLIVERVGKAIGAWASRQQKSQTSEIQWQDFPGRSRLTSREIEVLAQIAAGASNKVAAKNLGISYRTVEIHRSHIMEKLRAKNVVDLIRMVLSRSDSTWKDAGSFAIKNITPSDFQVSADGRSNA